MKVIVSAGDSAHIFCTIFQHLKTKISELNLSFENERLYIQGMDGSQIGLFEVELKKNWFKLYDVTNPITLGINCILFYKMLNCLEKTQEIILEFGENSDYLNIIFISEEKGVYDKSFRLPLLDMDINLLQIPPTEYSVDLKLPASIFEKTVEQLAIFADTIRISCSEKNISMKTPKMASAEFGTMDVTINFDDIVEYSIEEDLKLSLLFSLDYLIWMVQFSKMSNEVSMHFKEEVPMKMSYALSGGSFMQFFLAPQYDDF